MFKNSNVEKITAKNLKNIKKQLQNKSDSKFHMLENKIGNLTVERQAKIYQRQHFRPRYKNQI
jgi:hypothetical protein